jgi:hypothetical protein
MDDTAASLLARSMDRVRAAGQKAFASHLGIRPRLRWSIAGALAVLALVSGFGPPQAAGGPNPVFATAAVAPAGADEGDAPDTTSTTAAEQVAAPIKPVIPVGKGMWLHRFEKASGGDPAAIVAWAKDHGLTHLYLRVGSSRMGFYARNDLDRLLPVAHAGGLKVVGWDFPYLHDPMADAQRGADAIAYRTPSGHGIDAFSADIETPSEGTNLTTDGVRAYGTRLRQLAGPMFPLISAVPRPDPRRNYPYGAATEWADAVAPMVYWINRDPATDVARAIADLAPLGKPVLPVGQAYDPGIDGAHSWGPPSKSDLERFMATAGDLGVASYSFWVWDTASAEQWAAIRESSLLDLHPGETKASDKVAALQRVLKGLGQPVTVDGQFGSTTEVALSEVQRQLGLPATGELDRSTVKALTRPLR